MSGPDYRLGQHLKDAADALHRHYERLEEADVDVVTDDLDDVADALAKARRYIGATP